MVLEPREGRDLARTLEDELHTQCRYRSGHIISTELRDSPESSFSYTSDRNLVQHRVRAYSLLNREPHPYSVPVSVCGISWCILHQELDSRIPHGSILPSLYKSRR